MNEKLSLLRSLVAARFPAAMQANFLRTAATAGESVELLPGKLVEVVSPRHSAGSGLIMLHLGQQAQGGLAWVDAGDCLDLASLPLELRKRVLWLRAHGVKDSLKAADMLLRDGNLRTVFLDLRLEPEKNLFGLPSSIWHRLRMLAEKANVSVGIFTSFQTVACAASRWHVRSDFDLSSLHRDRDIMRSALQTTQQRSLGQTLDFEHAALSLPS